MTITIRTDSIRHTLADLRALDREARECGTEGREMGRHLPSYMTLDDGSTLEIGMAPASDGGSLLGVFEVRRTWPNGSTRKYEL